MEGQGQNRPSKQHGKTEKGKTKDFHFYGLEGALSLVVTWLLGAVTSPLWMMLVAK